MRAWNALVTCLGPRRPALPRSHMAAPTHAASRLAARLEHLPHAALVELCALACTLDAHDSRNAADATLARHNPPSGRRPGARPSRRPAP